MGVGFISTNFFPLRYETCISQRNVFLLDLGFPCEIKNLYQILLVIMTIVLIVLTESGHKRRFLMSWCKTCENFKGASYTSVLYNYFKCCSLALGKFNTDVL